MTAWRFVCTCTECHHTGSTCNSRVLKKNLAEILSSKRKISTVSAEICHNKSNVCYGIYFNTLWLLYLFLAIFNPSDMSISYEKCFSFIIEPSAFGWRFFFISEQENSHLLVRPNGCVLLNEIKNTRNKSEPTFCRHLIFQNHTV